MGGEEKEVEKKSGVNFFKRVEWEGRSGITQ